MHLTPGLDSDSTSSGKCDHFVHCLLLLQRMSLPAVPLWGILQHLPGPCSPGDLVSVLFAAGCCPAYSSSLWHLASLQLSSTISLLTSPLLS